MAAWAERASCTGLAESQPESGVTTVEHSSCRDAVTYLLRLSDTESDFRTVMWEFLAGSPAP
jgi:hypothetical protein